MCILFTMTCIFLVKFSLLKKKITCCIYTILKLNLKIYDFHFEWFFWWFFLMIVIIDLQIVVVASVVVLHRRHVLHSHWLVFVKMLFRIAGGQLTTHSRLSIAILLIVLHMMFERKIHIGLMEWGLSSVKSCPTLNIFMGKINSVVDRCNWCAWDIERLHNST